MEVQPLINPNTFHDYLTRLLAIGNSVSALGAFLLLTKGMPRNKINQIIFISSLTCLITLVGFMFIGTRILNFFGVSINAFQVAGGILLGKVGLEMLGHSPEKINDPKSNNQKINLHRIDSQNMYSEAVVPIAIPLTIGGATLSAIVLFAETAAQTETSHELLAAIVILVIVNYVIFRFSTGIFNLLGSMGINIFIRIMGIFTLSIGIQFLAQGLGGFYLKYRAMEIPVVSMM